jgi:hypothetical protein
LCHISEEYEKDRLSSNSHKSKSNQQRKMKKFFSEMAAKKDKEIINNPVPMAQLDRAGNL